MLRPLSAKMTTDRWVEINSTAFDQIINQHMPKSGFNSKAVATEQARRMALLANCAPALHTCWDNLYSGRRSAACRFEWGRLQTFNVVEVLPALNNTGKSFFLVTVADKRWCIPPEAATGAVFNPVVRKVRAVMQSLRDDGYHPVSVAAYEMSGDRSLDGKYAFEPHVHILIGGVPQEALRNAFGVRLSRAARGRDKPVRIKPVPGDEIGNVLGYLTKMRAQDRVQFVRTDGRRDRKSNRMSIEHETLWLRCMAAMPIAHLIQFGGFAESIRSRFTHRELAIMLGEL